MIYLEPLHTERETNRPAFSFSGERPSPAVWYEIMLYRFLCLLYAKGILSPARYRRALPAPMRPATYFYASIEVSGCQHLRQAVQQQGGKILGDLHLYGDEHPAGSVCHKLMTRCGRGEQGVNPYRSPSGSHYFLSQSLHVMARIMGIRGSPLCRAEFITGPLWKLETFLFVQKRDISIQTSVTRGMADHLRVIMRGIDESELLRRVCFLTLKFYDVAFLSDHHKDQTVFARLDPHMFKERHTSIFLAVGGIAKQPPLGVLNPNFLR